MNEKYRIIWKVFIILVLLTSLLGAAGYPRQAAQAKTHPMLLALAKQSPEKAVAVIVQKADLTQGAEALAVKLGGRVTKDLSIINAFVAEMSAGTAAQMATSPLIRWISLNAPMQSSTSEATFITWATSVDTPAEMGLTNSANAIDSGLGANGTYAYGSNATSTFSGFTAEVTPEHSIVKVEVVLSAYAQYKLYTDPKITPYVSGQAGSLIMLDHHAFDTHVGETAAGVIYLDITASRMWQWTDFDNDLQLMIEQTNFSSFQKIYYDAIGLRVTSAPGSAVAGDSGGDNSALATISTGLQANVYNQVIRSSDVWNTATRLQGRSVSIAVVDSGIFRTRDLGRRVRANVNFDETFHEAADRYGHGTFVAGVAAGSGFQSGFKYIGVAPRADVLNVRVSNDQGMSAESDVIEGLQWVLEHKDRYNIRVVNLSLNSGVAQSYHTSPLCAAVEILWFNGIVVVTSAGNNGSATLFPPANDPFVITVGATDDRGTVNVSDDVVAAFSAYGTTESGFTKPDLVTPGRNIISLLPDNDKLKIGQDHPANRIDKTYFKMSGTSVSTPMVSGAVALLLQKQPGLTPDQVKYRLIATANKNWPGYSAATAGAGYVDIYAAVYTNTTISANTGLTASQLLWTGSEPVTWGSVAWNSVAWNSVAWNSVAWNSVAWNSVAWNSDYWEP